MTSGVDFLGSAITQTHWMIAMIERIDLAGGTILQQYPADNTHQLRRRVSEGMR